MPHLSWANRDFVDIARARARDVLYARHTRRDNISDAIQNSRSYSSRAGDPSFISATPFDTDGSTGGAARRGVARHDTQRSSGSDYAFARNARLNDGLQG